MGSRQMANIQYEYHDDGTPQAVIIDGERHELTPEDAAVLPAIVPAQINDLQVSIRSTVEEMRDSYDGGSIITGISAHHGGYTNNNGYHYLTKGLRKYVDTWTTPYGAPYLINHDTHEEPRGRVVKARYVSTGKTTGYHDLTTKIGHADEIAMILDSRALTVSVGSSPVDKVECSFCGHDTFGDGNAPKRVSLDKAPSRKWMAQKAPGFFGAMGLSNEDFWEVETEDGATTVVCRHMRGMPAPRGGNDFEDTFWYLHGQKYKEVSRVNMPADMNKATGEFAHIREVLAQNDALDEDARMNVILEQLSRVSAAQLLDRSRYSVVSEKDFYRPTNNTEAVMIAKASKYSCMFDTGLWLVTQNAYPMLSTMDQVVKYYEAGGTFVYPQGLLTTDQALKLSPQAFANWLRRQTDLDADERDSLDRLYTRAYIKAQL